MQDKDGISLFDDLTRRELLEVAAAASVIAVGTEEVEAQSPPAERVLCSLTINNVAHEFALDPRVTLLDLLREHLHETGTKKGCDHGQCGACTVIADGERINSCLALAVSLDSAKITTIEGLAEGDRLHPMQEAFLEHDGYQCGFCTSGQICSAVAMLGEARRGAPSAVTNRFRQTKASTGPVDLTEEEIRERMSGNICRCGAYPNIVSAIRASYNGGKS